MSTTFPRVRRAQGYDIDEVEDFLEDARRAYTGDRGSAQVVTATSIRQIAFTMRKNGYSPSHVDSALERLEEAFAARERDRALTASGDQAWYQKARTDAQVVLDRATRPRGQRFKRVGMLTGGYSVRDVDAFADRVSRYLQQGTPLSVTEVREVAFGTQKGGYQETQVDLVLDAIVDLLLAVKAPA
ncbi:MAG: DivIVA domain-containing protein [Pseudolysinimonas sp.]|uniref:DivIVA domain-containing protein n=1 Tax=Pseudolysinimonas sp. TaxID=2680009 RepID=UPI003263B25F